MKINNLFYVLMIGLLTLSCSPNYRDITVMGYVKDEQNHLPITNAEVEISYWVYNSKLSESERFVKHLSTDSKGYFSVSLEEAEAIDLLIKAANYESEKKSYTVRSSKVEDLFLLQHKAL